MGRKFNYQLISNNTNQVFKEEIASLTKGTHSRQKHRWEWLMNYLKWYTNSFKFEECDELEYIRPVIVEKLFWNGSVGIIKYGEGFIPLTLKDIKKGLDGYIISATADVNPDVVETLPFKKLTRENCIFIQANINRWPLFVNLDIYLDPLLDLWELIPNEILNAVTKVLFKIATDDNKERESLIKEIEKMYSRKGSLIQLIPAKLGDEIQLKSETITEKLQELFKFYRNYAFQMTGRLYNASEKRERNITSEVAINSLQFDVVHNDFLGYIEKGVNNFNKMYNKNCEVKSLKLIEEEKNIEMQNINMLHQQVEKGDNKDERE